MRKLIYLLMLVCLPLHGFAMGGSVAPVAGAAALVHQFQHDDGVQHHHEDDGSIHYDDSDESREHAQEHSSLSQPAGFGQPRLTLPSEPPASEAGAYVARAVPEPFLDGPHKPPASSPGQAAGGMQHA